ncbi:MAG: hypothetical protein RBQ71_03265 [Acholeplasmataceae bacterium]|jgi:hypothetical protein|nr:hypothetical protein [Acholeplasmataceae bacterium]
MKKELVCKEKDGFWFCSIFHYQGAALSKDAVLIDEKNTGKFVSYINKKRIDKIIIDLFNCDLNSLSFLNEIKHVKYLTIFGDGMIDISPIYDLENLMFLEILNPSELYLDRVRGLQFFSTNNFRIIKNIDKAVTLKTLKLIDPIRDNCNLDDLNMLKNLKSLEILSLTGYSLNSLKGINHLTNLKVLVLNDLKELSNIDDVVDLKSSLTSLRIFNCKKIERLDMLSKLENLQFLSMDKLSPISNIHFINLLHKLKTFISSNTQIIDGDLSALSNVETAIVTPVNNWYHMLKQGKMIKFIQKEMPYNKRNYGDEEIEIWRRISY